MFRRSRRGEARPIALARIGRQRELRHQQQAACFRSEIAKRSVHASGFILEHPIVQQPLEQPIDFSIAILGFDAHQDKQAAVDCRHDLSVDFDAGAPHPLQQADHDDCIPKPAKVPGNNRPMTTVIRALLVLLGHLPLFVLHVVAWLFGQLLFRVPNRLHRITRLHLQTCFPELSGQERERIARASLIQSACAVLEAPAIWFGPLRRRQRWLASDDAALEVVRRAREQSRGLILLTPHQGAWELSSFYVARLAPLTVLYKPQKGASDAVICAGRERGGDVRPMPTSGAGVRALLSALKRGEMIGILPDHDPPDDSGTVFAPFFGVPANTMDLISKLSARSGAPVYFFIAERLPWARGFRYHILPAPDGIADPERGPAALNAGVEACVRRLPEQYWWSYRRFRRRPPGEPPFYPPGT